MSSLLRLAARYGVAALRTLLVCTLLIGLTTSAQPPPSPSPSDEPAAEEAAAAEDAAGWNFDDEEE